MGDVFVVALRWSTPVQNYVSDLMVLFSFDGCVGKLEKLAGQNTLALSGEINRDVMFVLMSVPWYLLPFLREMIRVI